jgi:TonB-linked SusC/RagA family outer membrane protein
VNAAGKKDLKIVMKLNAVNLDDVVVTALGITREQKSLGYAVSKVDNADLTNSVSGNWLNAMNGKVAGLNMMQSNAGPTGSVRVTLRGDQSLNYGANEALFVVDGVPISSGGTATSSGSNYDNSDAPIDFGNDAADINPDDVESVTVLKGPAATALYGSRAANGAIVITTKSGKKDKGVGVTINSSITWEKAGFWPDFQNQYGGGTDNGITPYCFWKLSASQTPDGVATTRNYSRFTWGEAFDSNLLRYQYMSKNWETGTYTPLPWVYADNWYTGIFETGVTYRNSVTISGNNGKGTSSRLSITDTRNDWILPNTGYNNQTVSFALKTDMNKWIAFNTKVNYYHKTSDNTPQSGYQPNSVMYGISWGRNNVPISAWRDEYLLGRFNKENYESNANLVFPAASTYNPYRSLYEELNTQEKNRVYGNAMATIKFPVKNLTLDLRAGMDMSDEFRTQRKPYYAKSYLQGFYREQSVRRLETNVDFMLKYKYNKLFHKRLHMNFAFGGNRMDYHYYNQKVTLNKLEIEGVYNVNNTPSDTPSVPSQTRQRKRVNSLYGFANFSWNDTYYLDITGRNDWSSALAPGNWSYFYPSVSASVLLDQVFKLNQSAPWVNMLKARVSWANVGNDTSAYSLYDVYSTTDYYGSYHTPTTVLNANIKPENVESWEAGIETRFFMNRVGLDVAVYNSSTTDQIVSSTTDAMIGATATKINAGEIRNRGVELSLHLVPIQNRNWEWSLDFNWSRNWNKLVSISSDWDPTQPLQTSVGTTIGSRVYVYSYVGQPMHVIYGKGYQRAPEGSYYIDDNGNQVDCSGMKLVNSETGYPVLDTSPDRKIGKVNPDWTGGLTTRLRFKDFSLTGTFSAQMGGHCYSVTNFVLSYQGKLKNTLAGRYAGLVVDGVNAITNADGTISYQKNTTITDNIRTYYETYVYVRDNAEENTFSTDFLKLKELRLDYSLPKKICKKTKFLRSASVGAYATNVFCITDFPQYDPETGALSGTDIYNAIEVSAFPMTRTYGVNVKLAF